MRIEIDSATGVMTINGIDISLDVLDRMTQARPEFCYQFRRITQEPHDVVLVRQWRIEDVVFPRDLEPMPYGEE